MQLEDLQVVLKVAEFRSITAAAANLDLRTATASAALKRVEAMLGAELFIRTTRQLRISAAGERYLPQCEQALQLLAQAKNNIQDDQSAIEGELRIALSSDFGRNLVAPWLDDFMDKHPAVSLRANISDSNIDFYRDAVDLALRYVSPTETNLYGFKICNIPRLLCASPGYLKAHGRPKQPQDLQSHNALFYQLQDITHDVWEFSGKSEQFRIKMRGNRASNDSDFVRRWCVAGKGLAAKSCLDMADDLLSGRVLSVMPQYKAKPTELWLVFPSRKSITPAARLLRDTLKERCAAVLQQLLERGFLQQDDLI